jgi:ADP-ribose pyrophosphatase YjhB (NUDIX family)
MKAQEILKSVYVRFGEPDLASFSLTDLDGRTEYTFGAFLLADHDGRVVLIRRTPIKQYPGIENYWWIPGGTRERDEQLDQTAVREFREETGLSVTVQRTLLAELGQDRPFIAVIFRGSVVDGAVSGGGDPDNITAEAKTFAPHEIGMEHLWMHTDKILLAREGFVLGSVDDLILKNGLTKQNPTSEGIRRPADGSPNPSM